MCVSKKSSMAGLLASDLLDFLIVFSVSGEWDFIEATF